MAKQLTKNEIVGFASKATSSKELNELTVAQLRVAVREAVKDVNLRSQYKSSEQAEIALNKLKIAGLEVADRGNFEKSQRQINKQRVNANVNWKSKKDLIKQMQALNKYRKADTESDQARQEYEEGFMDAYNKFRSSEMGSNYPSITAEDFKNIVNKLDTFENAISKKEFKYEIFEAVQTARSEGKDVNYDAIFEALTGADNTEDAIDDMYEALGIVRNE